MHPAGIVLTAERPEATSAHLASLRQRDRVFWAGFAAALLAHAMLIIGIGSARQRTLGTPDGANDAIAVEIVDGATLKDSMEPPSPATTPPGQQPQQTAALPEQQPAQPPPEPQVEPEPPTEAVPPPPTPETAQPAETPPAEKEAAKPPADTLPAVDEAPPADADQKPPTKEAAQPEPPKPEVPKVETNKPPAKKVAKQPPKKRTQTSALDLSVPYSSEGSSSDAGSGSAVQRPPGITRSGENDEFARNVVRALQRSMPRERAHGRVTVRIVLTENGSRADVKLLASGGDPDLDFNVMFAARQTAYPFPPKKSTVLDRTFTVTYIYR
ncbi:MAG: TonB family protein [Hyphomicrobium sp.]|jgi:TonB family protein